MTVLQHAHHHDGPGSELDEMQLRVRALESILTEKGYVNAKALDLIVDAYETKIGPHIGARIVAKAWTDPEFKRRLVADATAAVASLGLTGRAFHLVAVENTPRRHNMVVCTLCSCYPWEVLGLPPVWYKSSPYRSRAVIDPRGTLHELGLDIEDEVEVRVWDSTAELRYLVLPQRPGGTEGLREEQLAALVSRDAMIGVARVTAPAAAR